MAGGEPARTTWRRRRWTGLAALALVSSVLVGVLGYQAAAGPSSAASPLAGERLAHPPPDEPEEEPQRPLGEADGLVPDGVTVFDDNYPAVAKLDPRLLGALRRVATDAAASRVVFYVDSGWRSPRYQEQLLDEAIAKYGSEQEAAKWVATPATSAHVSGDAVDIGHSAATAWLSRHGAEYGLCQTYRNEPWHYELHPDAVNRGCPPMYADPTRDPRMRPRGPYPSASAVTSSRSLGVRTQSALAAFVVA